MYWIYNSQGLFLFAILGRFLRGMSWNKFFLKIYF
jgi:hypothetical protein